MNQYVICKMYGCVFSFLLENGKAAEIHCDSEKEESVLGNIYTGRVRDIAGNIGAAFVETDHDTVCYLPLLDIENPIYTKKGNSDKLQENDELLVQVKGEAIKTKYPSVTTNLTLHGKYVLLTTGKTQISASLKLGKNERTRLTDLAAKIVDDEGWDVNRKAGWLMRTNAAGASEQILKRDMERLYAVYDSLLTKGIHRTVHSCVLKSPSAWIARLTDLYVPQIQDPENPSEQNEGEDVLHGRNLVRADQFITDDRDIWEEAKAYLSDVQMEDLSKLSFYEDQMQPLYKKYSLEKQLEQALSERVWLDLGGYLVIEPTEALTVIDVNSGKYEGSSKNREKAFLKINMEAAAEAARQIRLRNLSGIILVDFINMDRKEDNEKLLNYFNSLLCADPVKTSLVDMTKLALVEVTRMKKERPLHEACHNIRNEIHV